MRFKQKIIIVYLDGTLCDSSHRKHFVEKKPKDFKSFYEGMVNDKPNDWCYYIVNSLSEANVFIFYVTGRPSEYYEKTIAWLEKNGLPYEYNAVLFMRPTLDFRQDTEIKKEIYEREIKDKYDILFCIDDRPQVARMWRELGLVCLQCDDKEF